MTPVSGMPLPVSREVPTPPLSMGSLAVEAQQRDSALMENGVGLLCHRIVPPAALGGRMPEAFFTNDSINTGTYFTDLITNDFSFGSQANSSQHCEKSMPQDVPPVPVKVHPKRSKNFSDDEDILLVSAWLNVTLDPVNGVDQSRSTYWKRIYDYFHGNKTFDSDRPKGSLMNRWCGIQHDVNVFAGCLSKIEARNHSGWSIDDKHANACTMFKAEDKYHRNFPYMHCWKLLKDQPKWMERRKNISTPKTGSEKQKVTTNSSPAAGAPSGDIVVNESQPTESTMERPAGKKKEKQKLRQRSSLEAVEYLMTNKKEYDAEKELKKEERCKKALALEEERCNKKLALEEERYNKKLALEEERIRLDKERFEFNRQVEEERIMNIDLSTMPSKLQQYYEGRQIEILARRLNK